jgi:hypothetical protein
MSAIANRLERLAELLGVVTAGSAAADQAIHEMLGRTGPVASYTTHDGVARQLLPPDFTWLSVDFENRSFHASCCRFGVMRPEFEQRARTLPLALCGAALRAHVGVTSGASAGPGLDGSGLAEG